ncbi:MAG: radical SAM family heme chaperone HemW [Armatimonadetes bacterium]|nr:radical SAM family heme chaperone HemW [Armatimonadota bacterium]
MSIGLYIHIPFCASKCPYCDFHSFPGREYLMAAYVEALTSELDLRLRRSPDAQADTLFWGGGTPTLLPDSSIHSLGLFLQDCFPAGWKEFTVEANPGTVTPRKLEILLEIGVTRLSLGVQSFLDRSLNSLGRIHTRADSLNAFRAARASGFTRISLDLIYGLPDQSLSLWEDDLREAVSLQPEHISAYCLTLEPGTPFYGRWKRGELRLPDEEASVAMYEKTLETLERVRYRQYEISNFALAGEECKHNLRYWRGGPYWGIGAGAHSYFGGARSWNKKKLESYLSDLREGRLPVGGREWLPKEKRLGEAIMLGLRTLSGVDLQDLFRSNEVTPDGRYDTLIERFRAQGLLLYDPPNLRLTQKGFLVSDTIFCEFL